MYRNRCFVFCFCFVCEINRESEKCNLMEACTNGASGDKNFHDSLYCSYITIPYNIYVQCVPCWLYIVFNVWLNWQQRVPPNMASSSTCTLNFFQPFPQILFYFYNVFSQRTVFSRSSKFRSHLFWIQLFT